MQALYFLSYKSLDEVYSQYCASGMLCRDKETALEAAIESGAYSDGVRIFKITEVKL